MNGIGFNMLKIGSKRRRTQEEIKNEKEESMLKEQSIQDKMAQWDALQQRIQELEASNANQSAAATILQEIINSGELT